MIVVSFSPPPSANKLWRPSVDRRGFAKLVKTHNYHSWIDAAAWAIKAQLNSPPMRGDIAASIKVPRKSKLSDLDNRVKPCFDALQAGGAIENDRQIIRFTVAWSAPENDYVEIELHEVAA